MLATQTQVSDGTLSTVNVGIPYFDKDDISISLDQDLPLLSGVDYLWVSNTAIQFRVSAAIPTGVIPAGVVVLLRRTTKADRMYNIYDGGAPFSRITLDENFLQLLFRAQEFAEGLGIDGLQNHLDMHGYRITRLGNAELSTDALPKGQADTLYVNASGDVMTGPLNMGGNSVRNLAAPVSDTDPVRVFELNTESSYRQAADASLQAQLSGATPLASPFSVVSWHDQVIGNSVVVPEGKNAWSFGPRVAIGPGQAVTVSEGSFWTIADGRTTDEGPLVAEIPDNLDMGALV